MTLNRMTKTFPNASAAPARARIVPLIPSGRVRCLRMRSEMSKYFPSMHATGVDGDETRDPSGQRG